MTETVNQYYADINDPDDSGHEEPDFQYVVLATDYARLEQECERLRNEQGAETFLTLTGEIVKAKAERDAALKLLAKCQEKLDPHRDAVLWGEVCDAFKVKP